MISITLRAGVDVKDVADQLASTINCPSFASSRAKGIILSPGSSCAGAVGKALIELNKEFQVMWKYMIVGEHNDDEDKNEGDCNFDKEELKFLKENDEMDFVNKYQKCPICGNKIAHSGGCVSCVNGCWSKCE